MTNHEDFMVEEFNSFNMLEDAGNVWGAMLSGMVLWDKITKIPTYEEYVRVRHAEYAEQIIEKSDKERVRRFNEQVNLFNKNFKKLKDEENEEGALSYCNKALAILRGQE